MVLRRHNYADGGKIVRDHCADGGEVEKPTYARAFYDRARRMVGLKDSDPGPPKKKKAAPSDLGTGAAAAAADTLANKRKKQMDDLGL